MNRNRHNAGFSLVEVIVAIAILSVALVGLVRGITMALSSSKESELQTTAAMFAAGMIEELRAEGEITDGQTGGACGPELPLYTWTESITPAGVDGLHQVEVSVQNARSRQEIYKLQTLVFEPPEDSTSNDSRNRLDDAKAKRRRAKQ